MTNMISMLVLPNGKPIGLLTEQEASEYLGIAPLTLRNWRYQTRGPRYVLVGRRVCYRIEDLQAWAEERLVDPR